MKIPKNIKIGAYNYEIRLRDRLAEDGVDISASHSQFTQRIWIDKTWVKEQQENALFHEILEALNQNYELKLDHQQVSLLASLIYQILKDNDLLK